MKKILTFFLTALLAFSVGWAAEVTYPMNSSSPGTWSSGSCTSTDGFVITITNYGTINASYVAWNAGSSTNAVMTVSHSSYYIKKIEVTASNGTPANVRIKSGDGTMSSTATSFTWTSSASANLNSVSLYYQSGSGIKQLRMSSITITYETGSGTTVAAPTISPNGGNFGGSQVVTLSHADGGTIYYTLDGNDPTTASTQYSTPFTINSTTTVKAIAVKNGVSSSVASATFTNIGVGTIAAAYDLAQESQFIFTGNAVVTYQNGRNVWIRDNSGSGLIYRKSGDTGSFNNGDILAAGWSATNTTYNSIPEFNNASGVTLSSHGEAVAPFDRTSTGVTTNENVNEYVSFNDVTLSWSNSLGYCYVTIGNNTVYFRDYFNLGLSVSSSHTYDIEGIVYNQNGNAFVYMTRVTEVTTQNPFLEALPTTLTINDSGTNNTFTVTGSNLGGDNVGLTQTNSTNFTPTLTATTGSPYDGVYNGTPYWGFTPAGGSVVGEVAMSYTGRELSASETVTLGNNSGASATVTVNYQADLYIVGNFGSGWDFSTGTPMTYDNGIYTATITVDAGNLVLFARKYDTNELWNTRLVFGPNSSGDWWVNENPKTGTIDLNDDDPIYFPTAGTYIVTINANTGALTVAKRVLTGDEFVLVTSDNDVDTNGEYVLVYENIAAMGQTLSGGYLNAENEGFDVDNDVVTLSSESSVNIFTLVASGEDGYFKILQSDGNYIGCSGNNIARSNNADGDAYKWSISISNDLAVIQNKGNSRYLAYNTNYPRFSTYTGVTSGSAQQYAALYKRGGLEPVASITVNPSSLDLVIPASSSSVDGTVTVTETNTTGTTSVEITGDGASHFSATLNNGTLTVTYNGTATQANPDYATITLTNGTASATVTVTGYKRAETGGTLFTKVTSSDQIAAGNNYIIVFENTTTNNLNLNGPQALNGVNGGGTGATVSWSTEGSVIDIDGTNAIVFTLGGNASEATLSYISGSTTYYLEAGTAPNLDLVSGNPTDGYDWSITGGENGYYLQWTNSSNDVYTLRYNTGMTSNTDRFRIYTGSTGQIAYLYVQGETAGVATPQISPASGAYPGDQEVRITCTTQGATIYYTVNGGETQTYSEPFTVELDEENTEATVVAWAVKGEFTSDQATATYTFKSDKVYSIEEFLSLDYGEEVTFESPVTVLFDYSQDPEDPDESGQEYIWVKDRTGYTQFFLAPAIDHANYVPKYENGDVIPAGFKVKKNYYNKGGYIQGLCTGDSINTFATSTEKALADPEQVTLSELISSIPSSSNESSVYNNRYLFINKLKVTGFQTGYGTGSGKWTFYIAADENGDGTAEVADDVNVVGYNKYNSPAWKNKQGQTIGVPVPTDGAYYNVKFIFQKWSGGYEIMPIEFTPWEDNSLRLEDLVEVGVENNPYTISNQLKAAKVTWDENYGKFAIFAKDDEMYANKRYPTDGMDNYLIEYVNNDSTFFYNVEQEDYDQSNWIEILIPSSVSSKLDNDYETELGALQTTYENKILAAGTVSGTYKDALNPTIEMSELPQVESSSIYEPNYYCTANFLQENLDADGAQSYRTDELAGGSYFMMDAKPQEFCKVVWAYYTGSGDVFVAPKREGDLVNGLSFHGSFKADMSLCEDKGVIAERTVEDCFAASSATNPAVLYGFNAIIRKNPAYNATPANGAPSRIQPYTEDDGNVVEPIPAYIVYPLNAGTTSDGNVTEVNEVVSGKTVESVRFYNLMGVESDKPFEGVNIVVTRYTDGSRSTVKVLR